MISAHQFGIINFMKKPLKRKKTGSKILGKLIQDSRKKRKMTGKKLADLTEVNRTHISKIEHGVHAPDFLVAKKISEVLKNPEIIKLYLREQHPDINAYTEEQIKAAKKLNEYLKKRNIDFGTLYEELVSRKYIPSP